MPNRDSLPRFELEQDLDDGLLERAFDTITGLHRNDLVEGTVRKIDNDGLVVDIGYKSEGIIPFDEWREEGSNIPLPRVGDKIQVLIETAEDDRDLIKLSFRKAMHQKAWENILVERKEGDVVSGVVRRAIQGGLLVDIGFAAFLPASQVDIRRPTHLGDYVGRTVECRILKIDVDRRHIIVSRRGAIETGDPMMSPYVLDRFVPGQICKGVVKNIAEFGAFVDLGGIDGLLHITDMSWSRITSPHELVKIDQEIEVYIVAVDREKIKISLGLKQKTPSPWLNIEQKYPVGSRQRGTVIRLMPYGAFVELDPPIVGLLHISEMGLSPPICELRIGQEVDVRILNVNSEKQEISLGMGQEQTA